MNVYLVTSGQYSDYDIEGIFSTKEKAQEYIIYKLNKSTDGCSAGYFNDIEEIEVDNVYNFLIRDEFKIWSGNMEFNGDIEEINSYEYTDPSDKNLYRHNYIIHRDNSMSFNVKAKSQNHAIQIANQKRIELIENNSFIPGETIHF